MDKHFGAASTPSFTSLQRSDPSGIIAASDDVTISCHEGEIPSFVEAEMERLYGNVHSAMPHLKIYGALQAVTHVYVARRQGEVTAIFLFRHEGSEVRVLNEGMRLDHEETLRFARYVFAAGRSVNLISFHAIQNATGALPYPTQRHVCTAEFVLPLPDSAEAYLASLGKNTRRNIRRYMDKLMRSFPSFRYEVFEREAIDERHVRAIIDLNRTRVYGKNKTFGIDNEIEHIIALAKACGMMGVATIDGRVCAGAVGYVSGENFFFKIIAHDPAYNEFSPGILCCYQTICACIARGCKEYNFMWNGYEYKFALGAKPRNLEHLAIHRSRLHMLLNPRKTLTTAVAGYRYQASALLEKAERGEQLSPAEQRTFRVLDGARRLKRAVTTRGNSNAA